MSPPFFYVIKQGYSDEKRTVSHQRKQDPFSRKIVLVTILGFFFFLFSTNGHCHQIYLKNGNVIETESIWKDIDSIGYEKQGNIITINFSEIEKIIYSSPEKKSRTTLSHSGKFNDKNDLAAYLNRKLRPSTPIEKANLSTIFIETAAGSGSGFFVSEDGLIITNRHVVRGSSEQNDLVAQKIMKNQEYFDLLKDKFKRENDQIAAYEKNIRQKRDQIKEYESTALSKQQQLQIDQAKKDLKDREHSLQDWMENYNKRKWEFEKKYSEFEEEKNSYESRQTKLAGQYQFKIVLADGTEKYATLYRISNNLDLALLKLHDHKTPYLKPAQSEKMALGDPVYAIGSPLNYTNSVTSGVLSGYRGEFIQTNAEIYPGNSGGPLVNKEGEVLGINTMKQITEKFEGLGFAIRIEKIFEEFKDYF